MRVVSSLAIDAFCRLPVSSVALVDFASPPELPTFDKLGLRDSSLRAITKCGFAAPSPIQAAMIPIAVRGTDVIGLARTGTGKTAAFVLPILERIDLSRNVAQALVLTPTRELSEQVAAEAQKFSGESDCKTACLVGGRPIRQQITALQNGAHLLVGTPGRVIDLMRRKLLDLSTISVVVLDEADRMLDIGFRPDIERILRRCPEERQTLLLSATMPEDVERLTKKYMRSPEKVDLTTGDAPARQIEQYYLTVDIDRKFGALVNLLRQEKPQQALIFTRTKIGADKLYAKFAAKMSGGVAHMHGDLHQSKRDKVMKRFRSGEIRMLIATDVVGRGIDISGISHIINYDIPEYSDDYLHRVGRTGRMSSDEQGRAITFVTREQGKQLTDIEKRINILLPAYELHGYVAARPTAGAKQAEAQSFGDYESPEFVIPH